MRLLHTETFEFQEFFDSNTPPYAILSHRWGKDETSFQDFKSANPHLLQPHSRRGTTLSRLGGGFPKIVQCCLIAHLREVNWVWIDTCCIDKTSSAELSEAINSMFRWYQGAKECYAYLSDVISDRGHVREFDSPLLKSFQFTSEFGQSKWFTRAWTLQELLAPVEVRFFNRNWTFCGTRSTLMREITAATAIEARYLVGAKESFGEPDPSSLIKACVAKKMSWVSKRKSTRTEDMAYCLLGIFQVNMPLLYGEGKKAFIRLQLEILRKTDDESIFAWTLPDPPESPLPEPPRQPRGMIAPWPDAFAGSSSIEAYPLKQGVRDRRLPYSITNKGLQLLMPAPAEPYPSGTILRISLLCFDYGRQDFRDMVFIYLLKDEITGDWSRICCDSLRPPDEDPARISSTVSNSLSSETHIWNHNLTSVFVRQEGL